MGISFLFFSISACNKKIEKNEIFNHTQKISGNLKFPRLITFETSHGNISMLKFDSWKDFDTLAKTLNSQLEAMDDSFNLANSNLNEEQLNNLEEELNFNAEAPLVNFENQLNFQNAYRKSYNTEMSSWLDNPTLNDATDPNLKSLFSGAERSLINNNQEVMIGDTVYHFTNNGYAALGGNYEAALDYTLSNPSSTTFPTNLSTMAWWFVNPPEDCGLWRKKGKENEVPNSNYIVTTYCGIRSVTVYSKFLAEAHSYKKKSNGNWKKHKTNLYVKLAGDARNMQCDVEKGYSTDKDKKRKVLEANFTYLGGTSGGDSYRAKNGISVRGTFEYHNQYSTYTLAW